MKNKYILVLGIIFIIGNLQAACGHKRAPQPPQEMVSEPNSQALL